MDSPREFYVDFSHKNPRFKTIYHWIGLRENLQESPMIFMVKTMVSCRFSLKPIQWIYLYIFGFVASEPPSSSQKALSQPRSRPSSTPVGWAMASMPTGINMFVSIPSHGLIWIWGHTLWLRKPPFPQESGHQPRGNCLEMLVEHLDLTTSNSTNSGCDHQFFRNLPWFYQEHEDGRTKIYKNHENRIKLAYPSIRTSPLW